MATTYRLQSKSNTLRMTDIAAASFGLDQQDVAAAAAHVKNTQQAVQVGDMIARPFYHTKGVGISYERIVEDPMQALAASEPIGEFTCEPECEH